MQYKAVSWKTDRTSGFYINIDRVRFTNVLLYICEMKKQIHSKSSEYIYTAVKSQRYDLIQGLCCRLCEQDIGFTLLGVPLRKLVGKWTWDGARNLPVPVRHDELLVLKGGGTHEVRKLGVIILAENFVFSAFATYGSTVFLLKFLHVDCMLGNHDEATRSEGWLLVADFKLRLT